MNWFTGSVMFVLIWWTALFGVLPFVSRPDADPDSVSGVRGAQKGSFVLRTIILTTIVTAALWLACLALLSSDLLSFRHGWFAMHGDCASDSRFCT